MTFSACFYRTLSRQYLALPGSWILVCEAAHIGGKLVQPKCSVGLSFFNQSCGALCGGCSFPPPSYLPFNTPGLPPGGPNQGGPALIFAHLRSVLVRQNPHLFLVLLRFNRAKLGFFAWVLETYTETVFNCCLLVAILVVWFLDPCTFKKDSYGYIGWGFLYLYRA